VHGTNSFDAVEFVEYLRERRALFLISCGIAIVLTLAVSAMLPKRYTAKSSVLIEAPPGNDPRAATMLNPAWLESLKTYESFASSDTLFLRAIQRFHVDASKRSTLSVSRLPSTTVIEISARLNDPGKAQALAQYIAEQTVELNRTIEANSADERIGELRRQSQAALERLNRATQTRDAFVASHPVEALENELRNGSDFEFRLERDLASEQANLADYASQPNPGAEPVRQQMASAQARIQAIGNQRRELAGLLEKQASQLEARKSRRSALEDEQQAARNAYEEMRDSLNSALSWPQFRGARLQVIDPGIIPRQPSFPDTQLNVVTAFLASLTGTFAFLAMRFGYVRLQRERSERLYSLS
jgi:uncharacterized protein involved in exopolysaccharide biosynthesis